MEQIKRALVNLRDEYQNFIIWRYLDEMSISEIAQITEKSEGSVRVGVHRALAALKDKMLENPGENHPEAVFAEKLREEV